MDHRTAVSRVGAALAVVAGLAALALSFTGFYRYAVGPALVRLCRINGGNCDVTLGIRDAWHGGFGWLGVLLALAGAIFSIPTALGSGYRRLLAAAAVVCYAGATASIAGAAAQIPALTGSMTAIDRTLGAPVRYDQVVAQGREWGLWAVFAVVVVGLAAATASLLTPAGPVPPAVEAADAGSDATV